MTTEQVYGRNAVRELLRGPRGVRELWATERALTAEPWLKEQNGIRVQVRPERELTEAIGSRDHQGVLARCEPYRYADAYELAATDRPLLVCLDRSPTRTASAGVGAPRRRRQVSSSAHGVRRVTRRCRASAECGRHLPVRVVPDLPAT
jgi:hypothetical protein